MPEPDLNALKNLSPFELKDKLIAIAKSDDDRMMLNAGRGNPNFLATLPRRALLRFGEFAIEEAERSYAFLEAGFGGKPETEGITDRFEAFAQNHAQDEGVRSVREAIAYAKDELGIGEGDLLSEFAGAFLGCNYPTPPRMLTHCESIVKRYIAQEMYGPTPESGAFDLFATEGGTAAMTYLFQSFKLNGLMKAGDKAALVTPIFSPYLEIPVLPEYGLDVVNVRMSEDDDWQIPPEEIAKLEDPSVRVLCVVNPSNPPSTKLAKSSLDRLAQLVETKRRDLIIITDDVYGTFADDFVSLFAACPRNTLCVYSFSKYFGATGWRLGVIGLHHDNVIDDAIQALPDAIKKAQQTRYRSLTNDAGSLRFIDRLVADSRAVALNHTAGISTPQQLQMAFFALNGLLDRQQTYKNAAKRIIRDRYERLCKNIGNAPVRGPNEVDYYTLIDLERLGRELYGDAFAEWFAKSDRGLDFLFRLAKETGVVLLPGKGFEVLDPSARVSLANLTEHDYESIGAFTRKVLGEYHEQFSGA